MILKNKSGENKETVKILIKITKKHMTSIEGWYGILWRLRDLGQKLNGKLLAEEQIRKNYEELEKL